MKKELKINAPFLKLVMLLVLKSFASVFKPIRFTKNKDSCDLATYGFLCLRPVLIGLLCCVSLILLVVVMTSSLVPQYFNIT